jgi:hypothetical protein
MNGSHKVIVDVENRILHRMGSKDCAMLSARLKRGSMAAVAQRDLTGVLGVISNEVSDSIYVRTLVLI